MYVYIYIYIVRERCMYTYMYIYIYTHVCPAEVFPLHLLRLGGLDLRRLCYNIVSTNK